MNQTIERTYVTLSQAKLLNEKGFDVPCRMCVADNDERPLPFNSLGRDLHVNSKHPYYSAPEQWELVEWLRVNHGIWVYVDFLGSWRYVIVKLEDNSRREGHFQRSADGDSFFVTERFDSPQEALSAAFDYILKNLT